MGNALAATYEGEKGTLETNVVYDADGNPTSANATKTSTNDSASVNKSVNTYDWGSVGSTSVTNSTGQTVTIEKSTDGDRQVSGPNGNNIRTDGNSVTVFRYYDVTNANTATITPNEDGTVTMTSSTGVTATKDGDTTTVSYGGSDPKSFDNTQKPTRPNRTKITK